MIAQPLPDSGLSRSLAPRHVTMISMGGVIGAGVFVGSSAAIAGVGPAVVLSYLIAGALILMVMRMLAEMATALPAVRSFAEFARAGLGPGAGFVVGPLTKEDVAAVVPLSEGPQWFQRLYAHEPNLMKIVLTPQGGPA